MFRIRTIFVWCLERWHDYEVLPEFTPFQFDFSCHPMIYWVYKTDSWSNHSGYTLKSKSSSNHSCLAHNLLYFIMIVKAAFCSYFKIIYFIHYYFFIPLGLKAYIFLYLAITTNGTFIDGNDFVWIVTSLMVRRVHSHSEPASLPSIVCFESTSTTT